MKKKIRWATNVLLALVLLLTVMSPASAQSTGRVHARDTVVATNGAFHPLVSVKITANQGDKFYVNARMQTKNARQAPTHRMLVALLLGCADDEVELRSTQNIDYGKNVLAHRGRYIFVAPRDGEFECKLQARGLIHGEQSTPPARYTVDGANTWIAVSGKQPSWVKGKHQDQQRLIRTGKAKDLLVMNFTAPSNVTSFSVTGDVEMTNCYNAGQLCDTVPSNRLPSRVGTKLQVQQIATNGGYCRVTNWPETGYKITKITWAEHHKKSYHRVTGVPVSNSSNCTRNFRIKVYTKVLSGNDLMIERKPYSNVFVKKN